MSGKQQSDRCAEILARLELTIANGNELLDLDRELSCPTLSEVAMLIRYAPRLITVNELRCYLHPEDHKVSDAMGDLFGAIPHLRRLAITSMRPNAIVVSSIVNRLASLASLVGLTIREGIFAQFPISHFAHIIGGLPLLSELNLTHNSLDDMRLRDLLQGLSGRIKLRRLDLSGDGIEDNGIHCMSEFPSALREMETLVLPHNHITDRGAEQFARHSDAFPRLRVLDLSGNAISNDGLLALMEAILREPWCSSLKSLNLNGCPASRTWRDPRRRSDDADGWREYARSIFDQEKPSPIGKVPFTNCKAGIREEQAQSTIPVALSPFAAQLLETLTQLGQRARKNHSPEHAWRTKSDWFDCAKVERHRRDAMTLIDELFQAGLIEVRQNGQWRQYRARIAN